MSKEEKNKRNEHERNRYRSMTEEQKVKKREYAKKKISYHDKSMLITFFFIRIVNNVNNVNTRKQCIMQRSGGLFSIFMKNKDRSFLCTLIFILMFLDDF